MCTHWLMGKGAHRDGTVQQAGCVHTLADGERGPQGRHSATGRRDNGGQWVSLVQCVRVSQVCVCVCMCVCVCV